MSSRTCDFAVLTVTDDNCVYFPPHPNDVWDMCRHTARSRRECDCNECLAAHQIRSDWHPFDPDNMHWVWSPKWLSTRWSVSIEVRESVGGNPCWHAEAAFLYDNAEYHALGSEFDGIGEAMEAAEKLYDALWHTWAVLYARNCGGSDDGS